MARTPGSGTRSAFRHTTSPTCRAPAACCSGYSFLLITESERRHRRSEPRVIFVASVSYSSRTTTLRSGTRSALGTLPSPPSCIGSPTVPDSPLSLVSLLLIVTPEVCQFPGTGNLLPQPQPRVGVALQPRGLSTIWLLLSRRRLCDARVAARCFLALLPVVSQPIP